MIQFRRGSSQKWKDSTIKLAAGQPGYDKDKHKLKIGDGVSLWSKLPYVSGLFAEEILDAESDATSDTLFTYGTSAPSSATKGKVYLQQYDGSVEADFVIEIGRNLNYYYRKWNSGFTECWGYGTAPSTNASLFGNGIIYSTTSGSYFEVKGFWK